MTAKNEVGKLYTGDTVQIANTNDDTYWLVYAPGLGKGGYVNKKIIFRVPLPVLQDRTRTVSVRQRLSCPEKCKSL